MRAARRTRELADRAVTAGAIVSGAVLFLASLFTTVDVLLRDFLGTSTGAGFEVNGYALAVGGSWALAYGLKSGGHVRIDVVLPYFHPRVRKLLDFMALLLLGLFGFVVALFSWRLALESLDMDARAVGSLRTPLFIPQGLMAVGFSALALLAGVMSLAGLAEQFVAPKDRLPSAPDSQSSPSADVPLQRL